jgi:magnesium chelatase subunit I
MKDEVRPTFPFTAIIGQHDIKTSLILNVLDPKVGGVIVIGDRGCGKSTTVRALVDLLPDIEIVSGDPFNSHPTDQDLISDEVRKRKRAGEILATEFRKTPIVTIPLGATEDRVCGTIDIEQALLNGVKAFEPGLLAQANRGILYIDEVNLLDDHLIDVLLDSAASGWNVVEREGISIRHPAAFILIGSGNPEEGEIRPQLLDRFGLHAQIATTRDPALRAEIVIRREIFDSSPSEFRQHWENCQEAMRLDIRIRSMLLTKKRIRIDQKQRLIIRKLCSDLNIDGLRGDIAITRAATSHRAWELAKKLRDPRSMDVMDPQIDEYNWIECESAEETRVRHEQAYISCYTDDYQYDVKLRDLKRVARLALSHRMRKDPLQPSELDNYTLIDETLDEITNCPLLVIGNLLNVNTKNS